MPIGAGTEAFRECCVELRNAVQEEDPQRAKRLHENLLGVWNAIDQPDPPANVKTALRFQGRDAGFPRSANATESAGTGGGDSPCPGKDAPSRRLRERETVL